jgi:hypothetical protein
MIRGAREGEYAVAAALADLAGVLAIGWPQLEQVAARGPVAAYCGAPPPQLEHPPLEPPVKLP